MLPVGIPFYDQVVARMVRRIVPEARVILGHGQMHERDLARAMLDFVAHHKRKWVTMTTNAIGMLATGGITRRRASLGYSWCTP